MKTKLFPLFLIITLSSCTHYYYMPNAQNVPLFKQKQEFIALVSTSPNLNFNKEKRKTFEIQSAYSITDHVGIMANYMSASGEGTYQDINLFGGPSQTHWNEGSGKFGEMGGGYFFSVENKLLVEAYGGFGLGKQVHHYESTYREATIEYSRLFIQPSFGYSLPWFDIAFTPRFSHLFFNKVEYGNNIPDDDKITLDGLKSNNNKSLIEPGITARFGWEYIKFHIQTVASVQTSANHFPTSSVNVNIGARILISNRYSKEEKTK